MSVSLMNSTVKNNAMGGYYSSAIDTAKMNIYIEANSFTDNNVSAVYISGLESASVKFTIKDNTPITGHVSSAINVAFLGRVTGTQNGAVKGTVSGNSIGTTGVAGSGSSGGDGIAINSAAGQVGQGGTVTVAVTNNTINGITFGSGISLLNGDGAPTMNATVTGNTINLNDTTNSLYSIYAVSGTLSTDAASMCADIKSNTIANTAAGAGIRARQRFAGTTFRLPGFIGSGTDDAAVESFLTGQNTLNGSPVIASHQSTTGFSGGGACTAP